MPHGMDSNWMSGQHRWRAIRIGWRDNWNHRSSSWPESWKLRLGGRTLLTLGVDHLHLGKMFFSWQWNRVSCLNATEILNLLRWDDHNPHVLVLVVAFQITCPKNIWLTTVLENGGGDDLFELDMIMYEVLDVGGIPLFRKIIIH